MTDSRGAWEVPLAVNRVGVRMQRDDGPGGGRSTQESCCHGDGDGEGAGTGRGRGAV